MKKSTCFLVNFFIFLVSCDKGDPIKPGPPEPTPNPPPPVEDTVQFTLKISFEIEYLREAWLGASVTLYLCEDSADYHNCKYEKHIVAPDWETPLIADTIIFGPFCEDEAEEWIGRKLFVYCQSVFRISPQYSEGKHEWQVIEIEEGLNELHFSITSPP